MNTEVYRQIAKLHGIDIDPTFDKSLKIDGTELVISFRHWGSYGASDSPEYRLPLPSGPGWYVIEYDLPYPFLDRAQVHITLSKDPTEDRVLLGYLYVSSAGDVRILDSYEGNPDPFIPTWRDEGETDGFANPRIMAYNPDHIFGIRAGVGHSRISFSVLYGYYLFRYTGSLDDVQVLTPTWYLLRSYVDDSFLLFSRLGNGWKSDSYRHPVLSFLNSTDDVYIERIYSLKGISRSFIDLF